jgi:hypothetical protein
MPRNQCDALSHLQIASADHFAREMGHMTECVLRDQKPCTPGEERLRDMILMDAIYRAAKRPSIGIYMTWIHLLQSPSLPYCDNWV